MIDKINFNKIVRAHLGSLRNVATGNCLADYALFFGLPIIISLLLNNLNLKLDKDLINILITSASIFAGLLLNLLMLIYTIIIRVQDQIGARKKEDPNAVDPVQNSQDEIKVRVLEETFSNVSFCILVSVLLVILCLISLIGSEYLCIVIPYAVYFLVPLMILTILMILKRVHSLIASEF